MARLSLLLAVLLALAASARADPGQLAIYAMDSRPYSFMNGKRADGLVVELANKVQERLPAHFKRRQIDIIPWARANSLALHAPNVLLLSIMRTPERESRMSFIGPIFAGNISAFALRARAAEIRNMGPAMRQLRGGARRGSIFADTARKAGYTISDETNSSETAARMLMQGRFELWFDGEEIAGPALEQAGFRREDVEIVTRLSSQEAHFAFSAGTPDDVIEAWETALRELKRDGSYQKIHRKWLPHYPLLLDTRHYGLKGH